MSTCLRASYLKWIALLSIQSCSKVDQIPDWHFRYNLVVKWIMCLAGAID